MARRRRKQSNFIPVTVLCVVVILCIIFTGLIVAWMLPEKTSTPDTGSYRLENAYIAGAEGGKVRVCFEEKLYEFEGSLEEEYTGIADLEVKGGRIQKLYIKPDQAEGVLVSYTEEEMEISGIGTVGRTKTVPLYVVSGEEVSEGQLRDLIVGISKLTFVFEKGRVCALVQSEQQEIANIRVLIKNGSDIAYESLKLTADAAWKLAGEKKEKGEVCEVSDFFKDKESRQIKAACGKGMLYLCGADGNPTGKGYEGTFTIHRSDEGYVLVNEVPMETYVSCVVPSEMPTSYAMDALKAQAVCARTFAYTHMKGDQYAQYGANLDDTTSYQVYNRQDRADSSDLAAQETAGQVLTYNGKMVTGYYYDTSPGVTADLSVWGDETTPEYLQSVNGLLSSSPGNLSKEKTFLKFIKGAPDAYDSASPYYRWNATINISKIVDEEYGPLKSIEVKKRSKSGYIIELECTFEEGSRTLTNENKIRTLLGKGVNQLVLSDGTEREFELLPSACFAVTKEKGTKLTLRGGGFGHGIGMSQQGAGAMGKAGKSYREILEFYFSGIELRKKTS